MRMFWARKDTDEVGDTSWTLPFSDMMSLLLAMFVMIAAMSELRADSRFNAVGSAVRSSFGFSVAEKPNGSGSRSPRKSTLVERLQKAGVLTSGVQPSQALDPELADSCEVVNLKDQVLIRVAGAASFDRFGSQPMPQARQLVLRIAEALASSQACLEVRGHAGDGALPPQTAFRDKVDLSYARARAVADLLIGSGIAPDRVFITACGDHEPLVQAPAEEGATPNRRIEIIVHAVKPVAHMLNIAEKERAENG
jgi:chemotaxis protein MotB